ncbi:helix-turn-helix domain-containing protein [Actinoplanes sp. NPDC051851]|uniref:helix-turn-helix domain-containing protein n=1 Tax=Actinoplanes sp. NPDC051851 TaxID=3154753 RepID=UPI0034212640
MSSTLNATAIQLSEAATRGSGPEHDELTSFLDAVRRIDRDRARLDLGDAGSVAVPDLVVDLLAQVCDTLRRGDGVVVSEIARELTTSEAARLLGVSRPTLIGLLDNGAIACRRCL